VLIYVPFDGMPMQKSGPAFRRAKEDGKMFARFGVTKKPEKSFIPDAMVDSFFRNPDPRTVGHFGIPPAAAHALSQRGVSRLYEWQSDCLRMDGVLDGRSLVYCAPTSGGKSLVAELLLMRRLLFKGLRGLYILPYVSICSEKVTTLNEIWGTSLGLRIEGFFSNQSTTWHKGVDIAVCTIEKASGVLNRLFEENRIREVGTIIMDELHYMQDGFRGYLLELMLLKLKLHRAKRAGVNLQIIGMSATLPNVDMLARWMNAALYETTFRPVPLELLVQCDNRVFSTDLKEIGESAQHFGAKDYDGAASLCWDAVQENQSVLCFCPTKMRCEKGAVQIAELFGSVNIGQPFDELIQQLEDSPAGLCPILAETIPHKVAYHHAGLTMEERRILEQAFREGVVRVLCCTSTLAAGVNLPCRRVIIRGLTVGTTTLDQARFKQMAGRAGRAGLDTSGECFIIAQSKEVDTVKTLLEKDLPPLTSAIKGPNLVRAFLECTCLNLLKSADELFNALLEPTEEVLEAQEYLLEKKLVSVKPDNSSRPWSAACSFGKSPDITEVVAKAPAPVATTATAPTHPPSASGFITPPPKKRARLNAGMGNNALLHEPSVVALPVAPNSGQETPMISLPPSPRPVEATMEGGGPLTSEQEDSMDSVTRAALKKENNEGEGEKISSGIKGGCLIIHNLEPTPLGDAVTFAAMSPAEGLLLYHDLSKVNSKGLYLDTELHLTYLCTPVSQFRPNWAEYQKIFSRLGSRERKVAQAIGVNEGFLIQQHQNPTNWPADWENPTRKQLLLMKHTRFYIALVLYSLLHEKPVSKVASSFKLNRGEVQGWQSLAGSFCGMVMQLCERLGWWHFQGIFKALLPRVSFGVTQDILPLVRCGLHAPRARLLHEVGYDVEKLARAEVVEVMRLLGKHQQFEMRSEDRLRDMATDLIAAAQNRITLDAQQLEDEHSDSGSDEN